MSHVQCARETSAFLILIHQMMRLRTRTTMKTRPKRRKCPSFIRGWGTCASSTGISAIQRLQSPPRQLATRLPRDLPGHHDSSLTVANILTNLKTVPSNLIPDDLKGEFYSPAGFGCRHCEWTTDRTGFSARQAIRAHLKKHVRERRAWRRPLIFQSAVVAALITVVGLGITDTVKLPEAWIVEAPDAVFTWALRGTAGLALLSLGMAIFTPRLLAQYGRQLLESVRILSTVILALVGLHTLGLLGTLHELDVSHAVIIPLAASVSIWSAARAGSLGLRNRRRDRPSKDYVEVHTAVNDDAEFEFQAWLEGQRREKAQKSRSKAVKRR